jgi:hypothetical protein
MMWSDKAFAIYMGRAAATTTMVDAARRFEFLSDDPGLVPVSRAGDVYVYTAPTRDGSIASTVARAGLRLLRG